jgi:hypothetical protein
MHAGNLAVDLTSFVGRAAIEPEPNAGASRPGGMTARLTRVASRALIISMLASLAAGCVGAASPGPSGSAATSPPTEGSSLTEAAAKEALLVRFGPLAFCDPDFYPDAQGDEAGAASAHLAAMRAEAATWAAIAGRLGFSPSSAPNGSVLLAAYREWKALRALSLTSVGDGWRFDARFRGQGPDASGSASVTHTVGTIDTGGRIAVETEEPSGPVRCPICLAGGTLIATPAGQVAVESLRPGDPVWSLDLAGRRVPAVIAQVGSTPVPAGHEVVRLILADGRAVLVSPGHPVADGRPVGSLRVGDTYDGSVVASAARIPYDADRTFDLLPSGGTGIYWANGIELGSTLSR